MKIKVTITRTPKGEPFTQTFMFKEEERARKLKKALEVLGWKMNPLEGVSDLSQIQSIDTES